MKKCLIVLFTCCLMSSCAGPPRLTVNNILEIKNNLTANKIIIVSDAGRGFGRKFQAAFVDKLADLSGGSSKMISVMTFAEYVKSPYNNPKEHASFSDSLFVFVNIKDIGLHPYSGYVSAEKYQIEAKYLDKEPVFKQEINFQPSPTFFDERQSEADELAEVIFGELKTRSII